MKTEYVKEMNFLIDRINDASYAYYAEDNPIISDKEFDDLCAALERLERDSGVVLNNSPIHHVQGFIIDSLAKVKHTRPMLSAQKTKDVNEVKKFLADKIGVLSWKEDGLTVVLRYEKGRLKQAITRGNGEIGEDVTHTMKMVRNVPQSIPEKRYLEIRGEAVIGYDDFAKINEKLHGKYKNARNLAAGTVRQLDSNVAKERKLAYKVFELVKLGDTPESEMPSIADSFKYLAEQGFDVVEHQVVNRDNVEEYMATFQPKEYKYPVDGLIISYNDYQYGKSLGMTGHHPLSLIAYKYKDDLYETTIRDIEWNTSRTGLINPVAVFDPVDLDGAETTRATLHNVSYIEGLELGVGDTIQVYRSNMVIPKVHDNLTRSNTFKIPDTCPTCGGEAKIINENDSKVLKCMNPDCKAKLLSKFVNFVSRDAMNVQGLSEATLKRFIDLGWLKDYTDIYNLAEHKSEMKNLDGFGAKSVSSLLNSIEESRRCKLVNFVTALGIELVGKSTAKDICKLIDKISLSNNENPYDVFIERIKKRKYFGHIDGIGINTSLSMDDYFKENLEMVEKLAEELEFEMPESKKESAVNLTGMTFVVTGKVNKFANRNAIKDEIESRGGKVAGSVSKNTNYLVNNDVNSTSGKNKKAQQLGIPIIDEDELIKILKGDMSE
ncbi:NAD-dependent DNA ligase LigA [Anaerostipes hadrus]|uniref:NAD-dependent DNA ligase LigA n=1 Tax=Anaerostipes hadrus TaxID=649756 RepID=UPI00156EB840|nr:NAD-dependent DNA ligase LigA [Anaerostipes hadrus]NSG72465.1 NAD-dependent DNA ligase LigA [Anaerostipes hadrus]